MSHAHAHKPPSSTLASVRLLSSTAPHPDLPSFPTRRSSDLTRPTSMTSQPMESRPAVAACANMGPEVRASRDRKSTRLNSSHGYISYAVFCLKKKTDERDGRKPDEVAQLLLRGAQVRGQSVV